MENWVIKNIKADFEHIMRECGIGEVLTRCLVNRGLKDPEEIREYLYPDKKGLFDPFLMKDMEKATGILSDKIENGRKIRIIGDYDVDGVVSTYLLYRILTMLGADADYEIPDRVRDGYGMNLRMVEDAQKDGVDTLITCDNGIVALEQVHAAKEYGMTVIVTDHHSLAETEDGEILLPEADAIINPKQPGCRYPYKGLCGAAIAYKLVLALLSRHQFRAEGQIDITGNISDIKVYSEELLSYVAIATVCDVMDLTGENRIIVKHGLSLLKRTQNRGLLALMEACRIDRKELSSFHLGFVLGPCLNASGRLDTAKKGLELLLSENDEKAAHLAQEVVELNNIRKDMTKENVEKAIKLIEEGLLTDDKVMVIYLKDCHESIAGIIAGRIRERYNRPVLILTDSEDGIKGSGRSIKQYNMIEKLRQHGDLLTKAGGHPMAAGFSMMPWNIEPLRVVLNEDAGLTMDMLIPKVTIDAILPMRYLSEDLINELRLLEPFGKGNEKPLFAERDLTIKSLFIIGNNASGIRFTLANQSGYQMEAVYFGDVEAFFTYIRDTYGNEEAERLKTGRGSSIRLTVTYYPRLNEYNGFKSIQMMIQNFR